VPSPRTTGWRTRSNRSTHAAAHEPPGEVRSTHVEVAVELAAQVREYLAHVAAKEARVVVDVIET
jgi:hypothetical protein